MASIQKHEWSQASGDSEYVLPGSKTKIVDKEDGKQRDNGFIDSLSTDVLVTVMEAEHIIDSLKSFPVDQIGSSEFLNMYAYQVERLSIQAHATAQRQDGDEYVVEGILTYGKLPTLVETLLAVEAWRTFVLFPSAKGESSLASNIANNGNSLRCAFTLHAESTIVGLLSLILFRKESCQEMDSESSIALVDYCARQMASLAVPIAQNDMVRMQKEPESAQDFAKRIQSRTTLDGMRENCLTTEFKTAVAAVSLARHLCEHFEFLPLGAQTRILDTHDFLIMFVPLIDEPPWTRRRVKQSNESNKTVWEKYIDNQWEEINVSDLLQITKCEAQCWLAMFHLTCNNICRERYALNSFRREQLLRLRKFLNNVMLDQLPVLADVMRYMDELALMTVSDCSTGQGAAFLMQQVSSLRENLIKDRDWDKVRNEQFKVIFSRITDAKDNELRLIASIYNDDFVENITIENTTDSESIKMRKPIDRITLSTEVNGTTTEIMTLTIKNSEDPSFVETPFGKFKRTKLKKVKKVDGTGTEIQVLPNAKLIANIVFVAELDCNIQLECDDIALPSTVTESSMKRKKEWRQLGALESGIVLQLGFKTHTHDVDNTSEHTYVLDQGFVSQIDT